MAKDFTQVLGRGRDADGLGAVAILTAARQTGGSDFAGYHGAVEGEVADKK